jgi:hypothetical protein
VASGLTRNVRNINMLVNNREQRLVFFQLAD